MTKKTLDAAPLPSTHKKNPQKHLRGKFYNKKKHTKILHLEYEKH